MAPSLYRRMLHEVYPILCAVNREHELHRLIAWAEQKRLEKPLRLYTNRLRDEEARILRHRIRHPRLVPLAYLIHSVTYGVFPPPEFHHKGAAKGYGFKRS